MNASKAPAQIHPLPQRDDQPRRTPQCVLDHQRVDALSWGYSPDARGAHEGQEALASSTPGNGMPGISAHFPARTDTVCEVFCTVQRYPVKNGCRVEDAAVDDTMNVKVSPEEEERLLREDSSGIWRSGVVRAWHLRLPSGQKTDYPATCPR